MLRSAHPNLTAGIQALCLGLLSVLAPLGGCSENGSAPPAQLTPTAGGQSQLARVYRLGIGDKLKISVYGEADLSGSFEVNASGNVPMPLVGDVQAKGRGVNDFRDAVARRLAEGYLKNPRVSVEVLNFRPIYVHGEVRNGGEFAFKNGLKVRDAVAVAGGYTYRADHGYVLMTREGERGEVKVPMAGDLEVLPGDNIRIPERFF